jgi:GNAT superfamily N-acetyltransferase
VIDPVIRAAEIADIPQLLDLRRAFTFEDHPAPIEPRVDFEQAFTSVLTDGISSGQWIVAVADVEGQLVSHAYLGLIDKIPRPIPGPRHIAYLTNVYTRPEFRGRGIGAEVIHWLQEQALAKQVELAVVWPSEESVEFYRRLGFALSGDALIWHTDLGVSS